MNLLFNERVTKILELVKSNYNIVNEDMYILRSRYMRDKENDIINVIKKYMKDYNCNFNVHIENENEKIKRIFGFTQSTSISPGVYEVEYNEITYDVLIQYIEDGDSYDLCVLVVNVQKELCDFFLETITNLFLKFIGNRNPPEYISNWGMEIALKRLIEFNEVEVKPTKITRTKLKDTVKEFILKTHPGEEMIQLVNSIHEIEQE